MKSFGAAALAGALAITSIPDKAEAGFMPSDTYTASINGTGQLTGATTAIVSLRNTRTNELFTGVNMNVAALIGADLSANNELSITIDNVRYRADVTKVTTTGVNSLLEFSNGGIMTGGSGQTNGVFGYNFTTRPSNPISFVEDLKGANIPIPASLALVGLGTIGLAAARRKSQKGANPETPQA